MTNRLDPKTLRKQIRYVKAADGTQLAWAHSGQGPMLVKAANWLTHLEFEWHSPVWKHWLEFFSTHFHFIRYDERGCGMSEWRPLALTLDQWVSDLGTVIDAAQPEGPVILLGILQGAATCVQDDVLAFARPEHAADAAVFGGLSAREREILALIAEGMSNTAVAARLNISEKTVRNHTSNLFDKLGVWSRAQAIVFARECGFRG